MPGSHSSILGVVPPFVLCFLLLAEFECRSVWNGSSRLTLRVPSFQVARSSTMPSKRRCSSAGWSVNVSHALLVMSRRLNSCVETITRLCREFGLTPAARARLQVPDGRRRSSEDPPSAASDDPLGNTTVAAQHLPLRNRPVSAHIPILPGRAMILIIINRPKDSMTSDGAPVLSPVYLSVASIRHIQTIDLVDRARSAIVCASSLRGSVILQTMTVRSRCAPADEVDLFSKRICDSAGGVIH